MPLLPSFPTSVPLICGERLKRLHFSWWHAWLLYLPFSSNPYNLHKVCQILIWLRNTFTKTIDQWIYNYLQRLTNEAIDCGQSQVFDTQIVMKAFSEVIINTSTSLINEKENTHLKNVCCKCKLQLLLTIVPQESSWEGEKQAILKEIEKSKHELVV